MKLAAAAGFAAGTAIVLAVFFRELSDNAEKMRLRELEEQEADWRRFLQKWEQAA